MHSFRNWTSPFIGLLLIVAVLFLDSCKKDEEEPEPPAEVAFSNAAQSFAEGGQVNVSIVLSKPVSEESSVTITLGGTAKYTEDFNTTPSGSSGSFKVTFPVGASSGTFTIASVNDDIFKGDKNVTFTLSAPSSGLVLGNVVLTTVTITEDESVSTAAFAITETTIAENATSGIVVQIPFSQPAKGVGSITVTYATNNAPMGSIETLPVASGNTITLPVAANATSVSFTVVPKDDDFFHTDYVIVFEINGASGAVQKGTQTKFTLNISEDEHPSLVGFTETTGTVAEYGAAFYVQLPLDIPASGDGTVVINATSTTAVYGTNFNTSPAAVAGNITLNVAKGATFVQFQIIPIDDSQDNANRLITFTIANALGVVRAGANQTYALTVTDNEPTLRRILISFGTATAPTISGPDTWNYLYTNAPNAGVTFAGLKRTDGVATDIYLVVNSPLSSQQFGKTTDINSGAYPDNALKEYWYVPGPPEGITRGFSLKQMSNDIAYTIKMLGSSTVTTPDGKHTMKISINGELKSLDNVLNNVSQVITWADKNPAASIMDINMTDTAGGGICPLNVLEISWYDQD